MQRKVTNNIALFGGVIATLIFITYSIFTNGQATFDSDTATATLLAKSIYENRNPFPVSWNYVNGEIWVFTMHIFTFFPSLLMKNQVVARLLGSYQLVILSMLTLIYHSKKSFKNNSWTISIPLIFLFLTAERDMLLYEAAYPMVIVVMCVCGVCIGNIYDGDSVQKNYKYIVIYSTIMIMECMLGLRYIAEQTLPMIGACIIVEFFEYISKRKKFQERYFTQYAVLLCTLIVPAVIGLLGHKWLASWHATNSTARNQLVLETSPDVLWLNTVQAVNNLFENFGFTNTESRLTFAGAGNAISVVVCILVCIIIPFLQLIKLRKETLSVKLFFWFAILHNVEMFILTIFFSETEYRYLLSTVLCCIIVSSRYIYEYWINRESKFRDVLILAFCMAILIQGVNICRASTGWKETVAKEKAVVQTLMEHGLTKGYASYWNAYKYQIFSNNEVIFGGAYMFGDGLHPYYWLVDGNVFKPEEKNTFLMLDEGQNAEVSEKLEHFLGTPSETFMAGEFFVYVYDHDIIQDSSSKLQN